MKSVKCFHQVFRSSENFGKIRIPGWGDCAICLLDPEENKKCKGYKPTTIEPIIFFVHPNGSEEKKEL